MTADIIIECPTCNRPSIISREKWTSKRTGKRLICMRCLDKATTKQWRLVSVPWLRVAV